MTAEASDLHYRHRAVLRRTAARACAALRQLAAGYRAPLDQVGAAVPVDLGVDLVLDNAAVHETRPVRGRLVKRPRRPPHLTPTGAPGLVDPVGRWFAVRTRRRLRRGGRTGAEGLERAIRAAIERATADPRPLVWTRSADAVLAGVSRFCQRTTNSHP